MSASHRSMRCEDRYEECLHITEFSNPFQGLGVLADFNDLIAEVPAVQLFRTFLLSGVCYPVMR